MLSSGCAQLCEVLGKAIRQQVLAVAFSTVSTATMETDQKTLPCRPLLGAISCLNTSIQGRKKDMNHEAEMLYKTVQ